MTSRALAFAWLLLVWIVLIGRTSPTSVFLGCLLALGLLTYFRPAHEAAAAGDFRPWQATRFFGYFLVKLVLANVQVALAVLQPARVRRTRGVIAVPIAAPSQTTVLILANAVSLTPGTFILEMRRDPPVMYVHVLQLPGVRAARLEILDLERRIVRAFGPPGTVKRVDALIETIARAPVDEEA